MISRNFFYIFFITLISRFLFCLSEPYWSMSLRIHSVEKQEILCHAIFSVKSIYSNVLQQSVTLTDFLRKNRGNEIPKFPQCAIINSGIDFTKNLPNYRKFREINLFFGTKLIMYDGISRWKKSIHSFPEVPSLSIFLFQNWLQNGRTYHTK